MTSMTDSEDATRPIDVNPTEEIPWAAPSAQPALLEVPEPESVAVPTPAAPAPAASAPTPPPPATPTPPPSATPTPPPSATPTPGPAWAAYVPTAAPASSLPSLPPPAGPGTLPPAPPGGGRRGGPGWGGLVVVATAAAVAGGIGGGIIGGNLVEPAASPSARPGATSGPTAGAGASTRPAGSIAQIAAAVTPSVVTIKAEGANGSGTGSGWVYDKLGHIVTNNHVVAGAAEGGKITVVLSDGTQLPATIVGRDVSYDLAVVKVDRSDLAPLPLGRSADVVVGDPVIAVGAPLGLESTVTSGIISALNRPVTPGNDKDRSYINALQTDAAINPGNSGGPLLNLSGDVIGVNSAIAQVSSGSVGGQSGNIGVGFAIPSDQVKITVDQLIASGEAQHPVIGVFLDRSYSGQGVRISDDQAGQPAIRAGGPAEKAGLKAGDVITKFDGRPVNDPDALVVAIRSRAVGDSVELTILRGGQEQTVTMVLQADTTKN